MADDEMVEVFRAADRMGAQAAIDEVLEPLGIDGFVHDRMSHALPAPASMPGGYFVAVPVERAVGGGRRAARRGDGWRNRRRSDGRRRLDRGGRSRRSIAAVDRGGLPERVSGVGILRSRRFAACASIGRVHVALRATAPSTPPEPRSGDPPLPM